MEAAAAALGLSLLPSAAALGLLLLSDMLLSDIIVSWAEHAAFFCGSGLYLGNGFLGIALYGTPSTPDSHGPTNGGGGGICGGAGAAAGAETMHEAGMGPRHVAVCQLGLELAFQGGCGTGTLPSQGGGPGEPAPLMFL